MLACRDDISIWQADIISMTAKPVADEVFSIAAQAFANDSQQMPTRQVLLELA